MKTPLFYVKCPTCEARLRFYDETRLGEIVPCPRCGSMVLVEKESCDIQNPAKENTVPPETSAVPQENSDAVLPENPVSASVSAAESASVSDSVPVSDSVSVPVSVPPVPPLPPELPSGSRLMAENKNADVSGFGEKTEINSEAESETEMEPGMEFHFEGEVPPGFCRKTLIFGTLGLAAGIFFLGVTLFFLLGPAKKPVSETALKTPEPFQTYAEFTDKEEKSSEKSGDLHSAADGNTTSDADSDSKTDSDLNSNLNSNSEVDGRSESDVKSDSDSGSENASDLPFSETDANGDGSLSNLVQSDVGKFLSGQLNVESPKNVEDTENTAGSKDTANTDSVKNAEDTKDIKDITDAKEAAGVQNADSSVKTISEESGAAESPGLESPDTSENTDPESASDPDALQFNRRRRRTVYSGDPTLDFIDETEKPASGSDSSVKSGTHSGVNTGTNSPANSGVNPASDSGIDFVADSVHVASPGEETVSEVPAASGLKVFRVAPPEVEYLASESVQKLSLPFESVSIRKKPVSVLIQFVSQSSGERILCDWQKLGTLGVTLNDAVNLSLSAATLREVLDTGLYQAGLGVISAGSTLKIVGWDAAVIVRDSAARGEKPVKHVLELEDLASTYATETSGQSGLGEIAKMIPMFVHPAVWEDAGGPGKITPNPKKSRITLQQYPSVIRETELFCDKIRHARNMEMKNLPTRAGEMRSPLTDGTEICDTNITPRYELSEAVRRTPIQCDLSDGTTLRSALNEIMRCAGAKLIIDETAITRVPISAVIKDAEVPDFEGNRPKLPDSILDLPCVYRFEGIPMEEAVTDVLKNVPLFCYPMGKDVFFLTTFEEAQRKMLVDVYAVGDIIHNPAAAGTVLNGICSTIQPETWTRGGGSGNIYFDAPSKSLIVRQNPFVLYNIEMFLKRYRESQNPEAKMDAKKEAQQEGL